MSASEGFGRRASFGLSQRIEDRLVAAPAVEAGPIGPQAHLPIVTFGLVTVLVLIFALEAVSGFADGPGFDVGHGGLIAFGGVNRQLALGSWELWRLATASLLHANLPHLMGNAVVFALAGYYLERLIGHAWFAAAYVLSGLGGAVASMLLNNPGVVSVGASGAIMGVLTTLLVCSFHADAFERAARMRRIALWLLVPSIIPFGAATGSPVDFNCHLGGATVGFVLGFALLPFWPETGEPPKFQRAAVAVGLTGLVAGLVSLAIIGANFPRYAAPAHLLAPDSVVRRDLTDRPEGLVSEHPHDPQARLALAIKLLKFNPAAAERESRAGLAEEQLLDVFYPRAVRTQLQAVLAISLLNQDRREESAAAARPACADREPALEPLRNELAAAGICPARSMHAEARSGDEMKAVKAFLWEIYMVTRSPALLPLVAVIVLLGRSRKGYWSAFLVSAVLFSAVGVANDSGYLQAHAIFNTLVLLLWSGLGAFMRRAVASVL